MLEKLATRDSSSLDRKGYQSRSRRLLHKKAKICIRKVGKEDKKNEEFIRSIIITLNH